MRVVEFSPFDHFRAVAALWDRSLGATYPISERALAQRLFGRVTYEPGDVQIVEEDGRVIGLGMVEIERRCNDPVAGGYLQAIAVDPAFQRRGIGRLLLQSIERRLREAGCLHVGVAGGLSRFWSGVPDDLPAARPFFAAHGYDVTRRVLDLLVPLDHYEIRHRYEDAMESAGVTAAPAAEADIAALIEFESREFPGWCPSMIAMFHAGDAGNVLMLRRESEIVGTIQTFTPRSRWRGPNVVWDRILGATMGGYGAVGIARAWRGRRLGAAMCQAAALHVRANGGTCCLIDWTGLTDFYAKTGARVWRAFWRGGKALG